MAWVDVILPLPLPRCFTYHVPEVLEDDVREGVRVLVPLGRSRTCTGIVRSVRRVPPPGVSKEILQVYDTTAFVDDRAFRFWDWMASYYMCTLGEVYRAAMPLSVKQGRTRPGERVIAWADPEISEIDLQQYLDKVIRKAPRQYALLCSFIRHSRVGTGLPVCDVPNMVLAAEGAMDSAALQALVRKNILRTYLRPVQDPETDAEAPPVLPQLSAAQLKAVQEVRMGYKSREVTLLHGVPCSGKTEICMHLISEQLVQGRQVLYLMPEIALTEQMVQRLRRVFGNRVGVFHSRHGMASRMDLWNKVSRQESGCQVVLGARSAVFLPFRNLGLVVVDEEHEHSYKQSDPAPRYHGRDAAIYLASLHGARTLLCTATPSVESYFNVRTGKYALVNLGERYQDAQEPQTELLDTLAARKRKQMSGMFHPRLFQAICACLDRQEQIILFQNRRGFAPYVHCSSCGYIPRCDYCDVSLTLHKGAGQMMCHYCGSRQPVLTQCPACSAELAPVGSGTEQIEEEVRRLFPEARVARMDMDSVRSVEQSSDVLLRFSRGELDILVGTQMITKGLDFDQVRLVGVIQADSLLHYPDFRSAERSFQMLLQVCGRAGRRATQGSVMIQTSDPRHPVLQQVLSRDYQGMYLDQLRERQQFGYPPYSRLVRVTLRHKSQEVARTGALVLAGMLREHFGDSVTGPGVPVVGRVQTFFMQDILVKMDRSSSAQKGKDIMTACMSQVLACPEYRSLHITPDVDPY
jgi:primosomal protein N' (replication factor Y)